MTITLADLTVERSTAEWGGPVATVTFPANLIIDWASPSHTRTFRLRSTVGFDQIDPEKHSIHVDEPRESGDRGEWHGAFRTTDMDEALASLVEFLNDLRARHLVESATSAPRSELSGALRDFDEALEDRTRRDFRTEWSNVRDAFHAAELAYAEATR
jgi:hypothetical protein